MRIKYGSNWCQTVNRGNPKEVVRMEKEKRRQRQLSKLRNAHNNNLVIIKNKAGMFVADELDRAEKLYSEAVDKVNYNYDSNPQYQK